MSLKASAGRLCSKRWFCVEICRSNQGPFVEKRYHSKVNAACVLIWGTACCICCRAVRLSSSGVGCACVVFVVGFCRVVGSSSSSHHVSCVMCHVRKCHEKIPTHTSCRMEQMQHLRGVLSIIFVWRVDGWMVDGLAWAGSSSQPRRRRVTTRGHLNIRDFFCRSKPSFFKVFAGLPRTTDVPARE